MGLFAVGDGRCSLKEGEKVGVKSPQTATIRVALLEGYKAVVNDLKQPIVDNLFHIEKQSHRAFPRERRCVHSHVY